MIYFIFLLLEIAILFLFSRAMSRTLSNFMSTIFLSVIFLPGVIVHELSHLFMAMILFVPVGEMEFSPKKVDNTIKLGSIKIAKTDPIRRSLIGFAPVLAGLAIIVGIVFLFSLNIDFFQSLNSYVFMAIVLILAYLLFAISNTMFSSKADMEGTLEILIALLVIIVAAYVLGFRPSLEILNKIFTLKLIETIQNAVLFLLVPIILDFCILGAIKVFSYSRSRS